MRNIFLLLILFNCFSAKGQISILFDPELNGRNVDGLFRVSLISPDHSDVQLAVTVTEKMTGQVLSVHSSPFTLHPGTNRLPVSAVRPSGIFFSDTKAGRMARQTATFLQGEYEYCYRVYEAGKIASAIPLYEECFENLLEPLTPLLLTEPFDRDVSCEKRPVFTWQPSLPQINGLMYRLVLVELKKEQSAIEGIHYNLPLLNQSGIPVPLLYFPPAARELEEGKRYAWQVTGYSGTTIVNRSEIWEFTVQCDEPPQVIPQTGYRDIDDLARGNFYIAEGSLKFSMQNFYSNQKLEYTITCLTDPSVKIKRLPEISLKDGRNNILIRLDENKGFIEGYNYIITIKLPQNQRKDLRFTYRETE